MKILWGLDVGAWGFANARGNTALLHRGQFGGDQLADSGFRVGEGEFAFVEFREPFGRFRVGDYFMAASSAVSSSFTRDFASVSATSPLSSFAKKDFWAR